MYIWLPKLELNKKKVIYSDHEIYAYVNAQFPNSSQNESCPTHFEEFWPSSVCYRNVINLIAAIDTKGTDLKTRYRYLFRPGHSDLAAIFFNYLLGLPWMQSIIDV